MNSISEFSVFGVVQLNPDSIHGLQRKVVIFPNPAKDFIKISIEDPTIDPDIICLVDLTGTILYEGILAPGVKEVLLPLKVNSGIYILELRSSKLNMILDAQKLVIYR